MTETHLNRMDVNQKVFGLYVIKSTQTLKQTILILKQNQVAMHIRSKRLHCNFSSNFCQKIRHLAKVYEQETTHDQFT